MKCFLLLFFNCLFAFGQTREEINKAINIPDSLTYRNEIRIYKSYITTNGTEIFRMYEVENSKWEVEYYIFLAAIESQGVKQHYKKTVLTTAKDINFLWVDIINAHILNMPDENEIQYKLEKPMEIYIENGEYYYLTRRGSILDGECYSIFIKVRNKYNRVDYCNPDILLNNFPGVDELESIKNLLDIIRNDFNIWRE